MGKGSWSAPSRHRTSSRYKASRPTQSIGWAPRQEAAIGESVIAVVDRDRLSDMLSALHGSGYGPNTRVLDGARGDLAAQLARASVRVPESDLNLGDRLADTAIVLVHAPGRGERVVALLRPHGPRDIHLVNRPAAAHQPVDTSQTIPAPDGRIRDLGLVGPCLLTLTRRGGVPVGLAMPVAGPAYPAHSG